MKLYAIPLSILVAWAAKAAAEAVPAPASENEVRSALTNIGSNIGVSILKRSGGATLPDGKKVFPCVGILQHLGI